VAAGAVQGKKKGSLPWLPTSMALPETFQHQVCCLPSLLCHPAHAPQPMLHLCLPHCTQICASTGWQASLFCTPHNSTGGFISVMTTCRPYEILIAGRVQHPGWCILDRLHAQVQQATPTNATQAVLLGVIVASLILALLALWGKLGRPTPWGNAGSPARRRSLTRHRAGRHNV
jgi:hypothetical protein